jgi:hypothetical protein
MFSSTMNKSSKEYPDLSLSKELNETTNSFNNKKVKFQIK